MTFWSKHDDAMGYSNHPYPASSIYSNAEAEAEADPALLYGAYPYAAVAHSGYAASAVVHQGITPIPVEPSTLSRGRLRP